MMKYKCERDKVYEEMLDAILSVSSPRPNVQLCANKGIKAAIKPYLIFLQSMQHRFQSNSEPVPPHSNPQTSNRKSFPFAQPSTLPFCNFTNCCDVCRA